MEEKDRRKNISFKNNIKDKMLLEWANDRSKVYGFSNYIKQLIEKDMIENGGEIYDTFKSR